MYSMHRFLEWLRLADVGESIAKRPWHLINSANNVFNTFFGLYLLFRSIQNKRQNFVCKRHNIKIYYGITNMCDTNFAKNQLRVNGYVMYADCLSHILSNLVVFLQFFEILYHKLKD